MSDSPKPKKVKTDKTEYLKRIFAIQGWIIEGVQSALIVKQIIQNNWCQSQRHAERMLQQARDLWTDIPEAEITQKRKLKIAELQQLKRSLKEQYKGTPYGMKAILAIDREINKLENLYPATKIQVGGDPDNQTPIPVETKLDLTKMSTEELELIVALSKKAIKND